MPGRTIDGRQLAKRVEARLQAEVLRLKSRSARPPQLDIVLVGEDPGSQIYVRRKEEACARVGIATKVHRLPSATEPAEIHRTLAALNADPMVDGLILQLPLPDGREPGPFLQAIEPAKDADCLHPANVGRAVHGGAALLPATPQAVLTILDEEGIALSGTHAVVINHSNLVGRPLAALLLQRDATVTVCHKFTKDLPSHTRRADVLVTATGVAGLITRDHVKPGAVVIDVGIARGADGQVRGDVRFEEVLDVANAVTPVPGGVGPMTVAMLLANVVAAHRQRVHPEGVPA